MRNRKCRGHIIAKAECTIYLSQLHEFYFELMHLGLTIQNRAAGTQGPFGRTTEGQCKTIHIQAQYIS